MTEKKLRGFAAMTPERRHEIAVMGGRALPAEKRSFSQDPSLAARAGRKGGSSVDPANRMYAKDRDLAVEAGRKGGLAPRVSRRAAKTPESP